jgi:RNA polymerase sigma-70 factor (ECF subfamily)
VESEPPDELRMKRVDSESVLRAIDELPVHFREALLLCEVEEMTYREIAEILSIPMGTVMSRLARARKAVSRITFRHIRQSHQALHKHGRETIVS